MQGKYVRKRENNKGCLDFHQIRIKHSVYRLFFFEAVELCINHVKILAHEN